MAINQASAECTKNLDLFCNPRAVRTDMCTFTFVPNHGYTSRSRVEQGVLLLE